MFSCCHVASPPPLEPLLFIQNPRSQALFGSREAIMNLTSFRTVAPGAEDSEAAEREAQESFVELMLDGDKASPYLSYLRPDCHLILGLIVKLVKAQGLNQEPRTKTLC